MDTAPPLEPYRYGLFSVAALTDGEGPWQRNGVEYFTDHCAQGGYVLGMCPAPAPDTDLTYTFTVTSGDGDALTLASRADNPAPPALYAFTQDGATVAAGSLNTGEQDALSLPGGTYSLLLTVNGATREEPLTLPLAAPADVTFTDFPSGATTHDKTVAGGPELAEGTGPVTVYSRAECNAVGFEDPRGMALARLGLIEEREIERYFSTTVLGAPGPRYPAGQGAVPLGRALGALEKDAALFYAGAPTLHAPRWAQPLFDANNALQPNADTGDVRRTRLGSRVAFGGGYADDPYTSAPLPAGQFWLVATGTVRGWRTAPFANETFTTSDNTRMALAERTYALDADCYRAAVLVTVEGL